MNDILDDTNFLLYAAKHYDNPQCFDTIEFYEDLKRFKYLKRLFNRYIKYRDLKERLILNHIIALTNIFGPEPAVRMLFLKLYGYEQYLKPFLILLNIMPEKVERVGPQGTTIYNSDIGLDLTIVNKLREI